MDVSSGPAGAGPIHSLTEAYLYLMITPCPACSGPLQPQSAEGESAKGEDVGPRHDPDSRVLTIPVVCRKCSHRAEVQFDTRAIEPPEAISLNLPGAGTASDPYAIPPINPTRDPSGIIDVAGWLTLGTMSISAARAKARSIQSPADTAPSAPSDSIPRSPTKSASGESAGRRGGIRHGEDESTLRSEATAEDGSLRNTSRAAVRQLQIQAGRCLEEALKFYEPDNDLPPEDAFFSEKSRRKFREHPERFLRDRLIDLRTKLPIPRGFASGPMD